MDQLLLDMSIPKDSNTSDSEKIVQGRKSIRYANRNQIEFSIACLNDLVPRDHRVRDVWEYTSHLDLSYLEEDIKVLEGCKGPPKASPRILLALWLYATLEGVVSARHLACLCREHHAYIWICGGVSTNYHSLADFRTQGGDKFHKILQESIALLWKTGIFQPPEEIAQDGTRVKASAGTSSLKTEAKLDQLLEKAREYIEILEKEQAANPSASSQREKSAHKRAAREKKERLEQALNEMKKYKAHQILSSKKNHNKLTQEDLDKMRTSKTDPECRKMKMGDGGFRPAFNVQFATSTNQNVILGVDVVNSLDPGTLIPMIQIVKKTLKAVGCPMPLKWLADSAYANKEDVEQAEAVFPDLILYSPPVRNRKVDALTPRKTDTPSMINLRKRMATDEAQEIYKRRSKVAEFANAVAKNRGMRTFLVRGFDKVKNIAILYAITNNMMGFLRNS